MSTIFLVLWLFLFKQGIGVEADKTEGILERIKNGLQYARNYLDTAKQIADLVSESLGQNKHKHQNNESNKSNKSSKRLDPGLGSAFFRLLGLDSTKIAAIAVNSAVFLAQLIGSLFNIQPDRKNVESGRDFNSEFDPLNFIKNTNNEKFNNLLMQAQSPDLPKKLIDNIDGFDSECIRLLICKSSPVITAVQASLKNKTAEKRSQMTSWLPERAVFEKNSDTCEEKHRDCKIFPEMDMEKGDW